MTDADFNETLDRFIQTVVDTLSDGTMTEYYPTMLIVDYSDDIAIEQLMPLSGVENASDAVRLAVAFGEGLADKYGAVAAVFFAHGRTPFHEADQITISGTTHDGRSNLGRVSIERSEDNAMRVSDVWCCHYGDTAPYTVPVHMATDILRGLKGRKR